MANLFSEFLARPNFWNITAACVAIATLLWTAARFFASRWRTARSDYAIALMNKSDVEEIARIVSRKSPADNFRSGLVTLDGAMQRLCGRPWSWRLFNTCLLWAFVGPIAVFAFAWLAGASGSFGDLEVLPELPELTDRTTRLGGTIGFTCALLLFGAKFESILRALTRMAGDVSGAVGRTSSVMDRRQSNPLVRRSAGPLAVVGAVLMALIFALTFAGGVGVAIYLATTKALATAFILGFAVALAFAFGGAFTAAFCAIAVGALYYAFIAAPSVAGVQPAILIGFFLALPSGFAVALYFAWSGTHAVIEGLARQTDGWRAGFFVLLAGMLASAAVVIASTLVLAALLGLTLEATNALMRARELPMLDWRAMIDSTLATSGLHPGAWLPVSMIACVLAPAGLFVVFGVSAVLLAIIPDRGKAEALFRANERLSPEQRSDAAACLTRLDLLRAPLRWVVGLAMIRGALAVTQAADVAGLTDLARACGDMLSR